MQFLIAHVISKATVSSQSTLNLLIKDVYAQTPQSISLLWITNKSISSSYAIDSMKQDILCTTLKEGFRYALTHSTYI